MSQKNEGLLSEEEVRSYLNETFNLKLTRDTFVNLNKDNIRDLYARFLDCRKPNWRQARDPKPILIVMAEWLILMLQDYVPNDKMPFNVGDLTIPDRRRTNFFLNALIYIKAQADDCYQDHLEIIRRKEIEEETNQERLKALDEARTVLEDLAIKKSQAKSADELREEKRRLRGSVEKFEQKYDEAERDKSKVKDSLVILAEEKEQLEVAAQQIKSRIERKEKLLQALDSCRGLKSTIINLNQQKQALGEKLDISEKKRENLKSRVAEKREFISRCDHDEEEWRREIERTDEFFSKFIKKKTDLQNEKKRLVETCNTSSDEESSLQAEIAKLDTIIYKHKTQAKILESQAQTRFKEVESKRKAESKEYSDEIDKLNEILLNLKNQRAKMDEEQAQRQEEHESYIRGLEKRFHDTLRNHKEWKSKQIEDFKEVEAIKERIDSLLGRAKPQPAANQTYIINN